MPLHANSQLLVDRLQALPLLAGRFQNMHLVNFDSVADERRGCFSLVFSADDALTGERVALKFFDQDPALYSQKYRKAAFEREQEILDGLVDKFRCLQLISNMEVFNLDVQVPGGPVITLPCPFFAVQWVDESIDDFFLNDHAAAVAKLRLFNEIVLAVEALHRHEVFHRDLKADNLRALQVGVGKIVVAIDLGTAARFASGMLSDAYGYPVGARGYAAPEAICGLAGNRTLAPFTDTYALGCLLFELFNSLHFYYALRKDNPTFDVILAAMQTHVDGITDESAQIKEWGKVLTKHGMGVSPPLIDGVDSNVPAGIAPILNEILSSLTHINYERRMSLVTVRRKTWSAIKILENQKIYNEKVKKNKIQREHREEKLRLKEQALRNNALRQAC
jgi:serine/threonine protein kinase